MSYTYGDTSHKHAVTGLSNGNSYTYDANGNMTTRTVGGQTFNLSYDGENRLVAVSGAATASFVYNGDGQRVKSTIGGVTTIFVGNYYEWHGSVSTSVSYYYAGSSRVAMKTGSGPTHFLLGDHLGSTSLVVDGSGQQQTGSPQGYLPWGETRFGSLETKYQYTGQYNEMSLGLYYYSARWYDAALGRFISADTIIPEESQGVQAWDRFAYSNNNPIRFTDPSGHRIDAGCNTLGCSATKAEINYDRQRYNTKNCQSGAGGGCPQIGEGIAFFIVSVTGAVIATGIIEGASIYITSSLASTGSAATEYACSDGNCTNEVEAISQTIETGTNFVYRYVENGVTRYIGMTNNFVRRAGEHLSNHGNKIETIGGLTKLSPADARAVEQVLIEQYGIENLYNLINSISATNPIYSSAILRGIEILNAIGFSK